MNPQLFLNPDLYNWIFLPLFIFGARILDVTMGTLRIIFLSRGRRYLAPVLGFFEVLIWIVAIGQIVQNLNNVACYLAYAAGFATGNFIGLMIEEKLALGMLSVRIFAMQDALDLVDRLHESGFGMTKLDGHGSRGPVSVIFTIIQRRDLATVSELIKAHHPKTFFSVEEVRSASEGVFPHSRSSASRRSRLEYWRKSK
jgi:uncharacterized protein YebE (UPF0316 family)